jgi:hypothetical protein
MPAKHPIITKKQILEAIEETARKLGRTPIQAEFVRLSGIDIATLKQHFRWFPTAVRAAGLSPQGGKRIDSADMLKDWGQVVRRLGRIPGFEDYTREGGHGATVLQKRFQKWSLVPAAFIEFVGSGRLPAEWMDVVEKIRTGPIMTQGKGRWLYYQKQPRRAPETPLVPEPLRSKKCVTVMMLAVLTGERAGLDMGKAQWSFSRRVLSDRPLLGPPTRLAEMANEPVNEMGVILLFGMMARRLGFLVEFAQAAYPDCEAQMEVEPGRWQRVRIEFEYESGSFRNHRHAPEDCDLIVCWRHTWKNCPENLQVLELSKVVPGDLR